MPNLLQLTFLLSAILTFALLFTFTGLLASYFDIPSPFFDLLVKQTVKISDVNRDMINFLEHIRTLTQTTSGLATASVILLGACALLYFNFKLLGKHLT